MQQTHPLLRYIKNARSDKRPDDQFVQQLPPRSTFAFVVGRYPGLHVLTYHLPRHHPVVYRYARTCLPLRGQHRIHLTKRLTDFPFNSSHARHDSKHLRLRHCKWHANAHIESMKTSDLTGSKVQEAEPMYNPSTRADGRPMARPHRNLTDAARRRPPTD